MSQPFAPTRTLTTDAHAGQSRSDHMVKSCQGMVRTIAWNVHQKVPRQVDLDDLIAYGQVGLLEAAREFDDTRGAKFSTYAYHRIRGAILDGLSTMSWFSRRDYHRNKYERMADDVLNVDGEDIGDESESDGRQDAQWFGDMSTTLAVVYLTTLATGEADSRAMTVEDVHADSPDAAIVADESRGKLLAAIRSLPDQARELICAAYFEGVTLKEAGERLGISKAWASRLHAKTLRQLAEALRAQDVDADDV